MTTSKESAMLHAHAPLPTTTTSKESAAEEFAKKISSRFDVVCFDLDQCAVQKHTRGRLLRRDLDSFVSHVSVDFVSAVPALLRLHVRLAIVTHSDLAQHGLLKPRDKFVLGDELVLEVLKRCPGLSEFAHEFFVVAWRPKSRGEEGKTEPGKIRHMRTCAAFYDVPVERCVLFDDDATNCALTEVSPGHQFAAYRSNPEKGFRLTDYIHEEDVGNGDTTQSKKDQDNYFEENPDGSIDRLSRWNHKWNHEYHSKPRFHLPGVNPNLEQWYGEQNFAPSLNEPILLPLCGKTVDLKWLADAGHEIIVGVEGVRRGIEELRDELLCDLRCISDQEKISTGMEVWTTSSNGENWFDSNEEKKVSIVCGDFFTLSPTTFDQVGPAFGAIYDRGAIVAVPPSSRPDYVSVIDSLLMPGGQILMVTVDTGRDKGPPFPVTPGVVEELFSTLGYTVRILDEHAGDFGENSKEFVFLITKPTI